MKKIALLLVVCAGLLSAQKLTSNEISIIKQGDIHSALPVYNVSEPEQSKTLLGMSADIDPKDPNTAILVERMKLSLLSTGSGVGIAAPQVGINRRIIWVQRFDKEGKPFEYFLNPIILWKSQLQNLGPEGDLSITDFRDQFYRSKVIQLEYSDLKGKKHIEIIEGFTAVIFQHEIDHLSGILISDKKEKEKNDLYERADAFIKIK
ncbi:peptide deformylase [Elizabethkingia bruuniana]|uniref:peptide deformylase n=1 Tax=Elizabethkingia bruuniana TaxID=1756149 RepID=UPI00241EEB45|nr:peptide deformylase [Elizabethkingia bruuniana]